MTEGARKVLLLGCRGSGKTSFIWGLSVLTRGASKSPFRLISMDETTALRITDFRALSVVQQWPPPTSEMTLLTFKLGYAAKPNDQQFEVAVLDYPGEDLLAAMESLDFNERQALEVEFLQAEYVLVLADPTQDLQSELARDLDSVQRRQDALVHAVGYLVERRKQNSAPTLSLPSIAVLVTKADLVRSRATEILKKLETQNSAFLRRLREMSCLSKTPCFLISSSGETVTTPEGKFIPAKVPAPYGYEELFDWLSYEHWLTRNRRLLQFVAAAIVLGALALGCFVIWVQVAKNRIDDVLQNGSLEEIEMRLQETPRFLVDTGYLDKRIRLELAAVDHTLGASPTNSQLQESRDQLERILAVPLISDIRRVKSAIQLVEGKLEEALYSSITSAVREGDSEEALRLIGIYRKQYSNGAHKTSVEKSWEQVIGVLKGAARGDVRSILARDRGTLARKAEAIRTYLKTYPDDPDAKAMGLAAEVAESLATSKQLRLLMTSCGFASSAQARDFEIRFVMDGVELKTPRFASDGEQKLATTSQSLDITFSQWDRLRLELWDLDNWNEKMAVAEIDLLGDLSRFNAQDHYPFRLESEGGQFDRWQGSDPWAVFSIEWRKGQGWESIPPAALQAYGRFISPGREW